MKRHFLTAEQGIGIMRRALNANSSATPSATSLPSKPIPPSVPGPDGCLIKAMINPRTGQYVYRRFSMAGQPLEDVSNVIDPENPGLHQPHATASAGSDGNEAALAAEVLKSFRAHGMNTGHARA
jgi:hypothetical protein